YPVYRAAGLLKLITAVVSWVTVIALIPLMPGVLAALEEGRPRLGPVLSPPRPRWADYLIGASAAGLALLARLALGPLLLDHHPYVLTLLAVIFVAWGCGFGPAILCLLIGFFGTILLILQPYGSFTVASLPEQVGVALFFFGGVGCAML